MKTAEAKPTSVEDPTAVPVEPAAALETQHPAPRHGVPIVRIVIILTVLILAGVVTGFIPRERQRHEAQNDIATLASTTVTLVSPTPGKPDDGLLLPAEVQPLLQASIFARVSGYLKRWNVDIGAHVEAGQVLAEIDTPEIDEQLDQIRAQSNVAEANLKLAKITDVRWQNLLKTSAVSQQEADEKAAASAVAAATVQAEHANVRRLEEMQAFKKVLAPFAGIVTARNVDIGDLINAASGRELFHVVQPQTLRVYVRAPQTMAPDIRIGQVAQVLLPELPNQPTPAKVVTTSEAISATSRTLLVELQASNPKDQIRIGSYCQVRFADTTASPALTLPSSTLLFRANGLQVGVVNDAGVVSLRSVELGRDFGRYVEVLSGVTPSDRVIATPSDSLVDGMMVRVAPNTGSGTDKAQAVPTKQRQNA